MDCVSAAAPATTLAAITSEHLLKLFENVAEASLTTPAETLSSTSAAHATETLSKGILATKGVLCLLVPSHASLIVDPALGLITQRFICIADLGEFLFGL